MGGGVLRGGSGGYVGGSGKWRVRRGGYYRMRIVG